MHKITSPAAGLDALPELIAIGDTEENACEAFCVILNAQMLPSPTTNVGTGFYVTTFVRPIYTFCGLHVYMKDVYDLDIKLEIE